MAGILVFDYDKDVCKFLKTALEAEGHTVFAFADAKTVLDVVDFSDIDLLITDLIMPLPGEKIIRTLRNSGFTSPIIALTPFLFYCGKTHPILSMGAQEVLVKPFDLTALLTVVNRCLPQPRTEIRSAGLNPFYTPTKKAHATVT